MAGPNGVYRAVRETFRQAGLDREHFGAASWNPLGEYIRPGQRVFLLCNFVHHRRVRETAQEFACKCTHASVIRAVADYALVALGGYGEVVIGNAPLQSCDWAAVLEQTGTAAVLDFYRDHNKPVRSADLRCYKTAYGVSGAHARSTVAAPEDAVFVEVGDNSLLKTATGNKAFAVSDYDAAVTRFHHANGTHRYAVNREFLESDVVIGIPKLKVHEKVALTCGLKNFVGISALKQTLPHHRTGSPAQGGDEYPDGATLSALASRVHAWYCGLPQGALSNGPLAIAEKTFRRLCLRSGSVLAGAWFGNDTTWRMTADLAYIAQYADACGVLQLGQQRTILTFVDGVVAGEGQGPLAPRPVQLGTLVFSDDVRLLDWACCELIGFDVRKVPLVYRALLSVGIDPDERPSPLAVINGARKQISDLYECCEKPLVPPRGWQGHVERRSDRATA